MLSSVDYSSREKNAIVGFHAFTGNHYVSAFFRKGKTINNEEVKVYSGI